MERTLRTLALLFIVLLAIRAFHWYPLLPDPFPIHFNGAGEADGWAQKSPVTWGLMALMGPVLAAGLGYLAGRLPGMAAKDAGLINLPDKERFLRLDAPRRADAMRPTALYLRAVSVLLLALFLYIIEGTGRMATGAWSVLPSWPVFVFIGGVVGGLPLLLRATRKAMDR
ncbi:MAG: DUF1648 domain-containing protein [Flavobacteriales bacterium]|nr:DUF1648 domain-containing protein [Flavobacteriales bacterium]